MSRNYRYGLKFRPPGIGCMPSGIFSLESPSPIEERHARHGVIVFDRPLLDQEIRSFELVWLPSGSDVDALVARVSEMMSEYAGRYVSKWACSKDLVCDAILRNLESSTSYSIFVGDEMTFCQQVLNRLTEISGVNSDQAAELA